MKLPFIDVVVPTFNRAPMLKVILNSLAAQDYPRDRYQIIIADYLPLRRQPTGDGNSWACYACTAAIRTSIDAPEARTFLSMLCGDGS